MFSLKYLLVALFTTVTVYANCQVFIGPSASVTTIQSRLRYDGETFKGSNSTGFSAGADVIAVITKSLSLTSGIHYQSLNTGNTQYGDNLGIETRNMLASMPVGFDMRVYASRSGQFNLNLIAGTEISYVIAGDGVKSEFDVSRRVIYGYQLGAEIQVPTNFRNRLTIFGKYKGGMKMAFHETTTTGYRNSYDLSVSMLEAGISYTFDVVPGWMKIRNKNNRMDVNYGGKKRKIEL